MLQQRVVCAQTLRANCWRKHFAQTVGAISSRKLLAQTPRARSSIVRVQLSLRRSLQSTS